MIIGGVNIIALSVAFESFISFNYSSFFFLFPSLNSVVSFLIEFDFDAYYETISWLGFVIIFSFSFSGLTYKILQNLQKKKPKIAITIIHPIIIKIISPTGKPVL